MDSYKLTDNWLCKYILIFVSSLVGSSMLYSYVYLLILCVPGVPQCFLVKFSICHCFSYLYCSVCYHIMVNKDVYKIFNTP